LADLADRCRKLVAESSVTIRNQRLVATVSVGGTMINSSDTAESVIRRADQLMYHSKSSGRNRSTVDRNGSLELPDFPL
jgi:PleD family two-component response regulator